MKALNLLQATTISQLSKSRLISKARRQGVIALSALSLLALSATLSNEAHASNSCRQLEAITATAGVKGETREDLIRHYTQQCREENEARIGMARISINERVGLKALSIHQFEEISAWIEDMKAAEAAYLDSLNGKGSLQQSKEDFEEIRAQFISELRLLKGFDLSHFRAEANRILSIPTESPVLYRDIEQENIADKSVAAHYKSAHAASFKAREPDRHQVGPRTIF